MTTRPNGPYFDDLRDMLACPLCGPWLVLDETYPHPPMSQTRYRLRVVAYRRNSARVECPRCGFRFTVRHDLFEAARGSLDIGQAAQLSPS